jgi:thioredoxin-related protein
MQGNPAPNPSPHQRTKRSTPLKKNIAALTVGGLLLFSVPAFAGDGWIEDFDEAVKVAKEQKKDLFVDFTGSDWCGWCIRLHDEVFKFEEFTTAITKDYVLVSLDFPKSEEARAKVPNPDRNREVQLKYGVQGFPTILLMNSNGVVYAQTGYEAGGAEAYVEHIAELRKNRSDLDAIEKALAIYEAATPEEKEAELSKLLDAMVGLSPGSSLASLLFEPARKAMELDPENKKGLKLKAVLGLCKAGESDEPLRTAALELDPKNAHGALEYSISNQFRAVKDEETARAALAALDILNTLVIKDNSLAFDLNFTAAGWAGGPMKDMTLAASYAAKAKAIGTDDQRKRDFLDGILSEPEKGEGDDQ